MPTTNHALAYLTAAQADKEITTNANMTSIDGILARRFVVLTLTRAAVVTVASVALPGEIVVPHSPVDGTTSVTWNVRRINVRLETAGIMTIRVQKSTAGSTAVFTATTVGDVAIATAISGGSTTSALGTVASGDVLRGFVQAWTSGSLATVGIILEAA